MKSIPVDDMIARIELSAAYLELPVHQWAELCAMLLPEVFSKPCLHGPQTVHPPGSDDKIEVLRWRAANNRLLFNPSDSTWETTVPTTETDQ